DELNGWLYEVQWQPQALAPAHSGDGQLDGRPGRLLIVADDGGFSAALCADLERRGWACVGVPSTGDPAWFRPLLAGPLRGDRGPCRGILYLCGLDTALPAAAEPALVGLLQLVQALAQTGWRDAPRLWVVTRGAQAVGQYTTALAVAQAPLWGLGR